MAQSVLPWWQVVQLRSEVTANHGRIDDVQMSLHDAVFGKAAGGKVPYHQAAYYGEITHPAGSLVDLMAQIALRLGVAGSTLARAVWRLDQAMGGGKSHGLIGLWHLTEHVDEFAETELGSLVLAAAEDIAGKGALAPDLGKPRCVVLDCDNPEPRVEVDGPARTLGERFLWRLFDGDNKTWLEFREHTSSKAKLAEAITSVDRPVLILIDEIMDYIRWASNADEQLVLGDMAFLRALLDTANDVPNCALVVVMIASDKDRIVVNELGQKCREELEALLIRNGEATTVSSGGDFADIIRRRLFEDGAPPHVAAGTARLFRDHMTGSWQNAVFSKVGGSSAVSDEKVARSYPFHPALIDLAEQEWSLHTGFQRVRSTIQVFAATAYALAARASADEWVPLLIGPGDLPLSTRIVRDALLDSGLVTDQRTQASLREIASAEIADPDHSDRGTARLLDGARVDQGWNAANPRAAERAATGMFVYSVSPRPNARRGATEAEIAACSFVPVNSFGPGDAEVVLAELFDPEKGIVAYDSVKGSGGQPPRYYFETEKTLTMHMRAEREAITDEERDETVARLAFEMSVSGPFASVVHVDGGGSPSGRPDEASLRAILEGAGIDDRHTTRLVVLDSRWFSLLNGVDAETREALRAAMGLGPKKLAVSWASSAVFACVNAQRRSQARGYATEYLAWRRVAGLDTVTSNEELTATAIENRREAEKRVRKAVKEAYQHVVYLAEDGQGGREDRTIRLQKENQSALDGQIVWAALDDAGKAFGLGQFNATSLLHNLREQDWGKPISEIRDAFWSTPRIPLLPVGDSELRAALFEATQHGEVMLVGADGTPRAVTSSADINLTATGIRVQRPGGATESESIEVPDVVGQDWNAGRLALESLGFVVAAKGSAGAIVSLNPPAGTVLSRGSTVNVSLKPAAPHSVVEYQVSVSAIKALRDDDAARDAIRNLLNEIKNAVDGQASHIQLSIKVTAPGATKDEIVARAEEAGIHPSITDL
jgi:hypothetical protein